MLHLEIEYKTLLNKDEFKRLKKLFSHVTPIVQTNYYFDSESSMLKKNHLSLRIRTFSNTAELTLKVPDKVGTLEHNFSISLEEADNIIKNGFKSSHPIANLLNQYHIELSSLKSFGHLTTKRLEIETPIGVMALDESQYSNIIDYELELEVEDPKQGEKDFHRFLEDHHINFKYAKSKISRLSTSLKHLS